eukprot:jgi/Hompol1/6516/HPOL_005021-RA
MRRNLRLSLPPYDELDAKSGAGQASSAADAGKHNQKQSSRTNGTVTPSAVNELELESVASHELISDKTFQGAYRTTAKTSLNRQLWALTRKNILLLVRDGFSTFVSIFLPIFILFILFILNISLSKPLTGTVTTTCVSLGYTNSTPIDNIIASLSSLVAEAEPNARIVYFPTSTAYFAARNQDPSKFVAGIEFTQIANLSGNSATPSIGYNILVNDTRTALIQDSNNARIDAAMAYAQTAVLNVFRANQNLPPLRSPLSTKNGNGAPLLATVLGRTSSGIKDLLPFYFIYMLQSTFVRLLTIIVKEKENKTKSGLVMMGTNETMYMLSAIISNNLLNIVTVAIIVLIVALGGIIKYTSPGVIFL